MRLQALLVSLQLPTARSPSTSVLHTIQELADGLLVDWNITYPTECVRLISVTDRSTATPSNASDLAGAVGWLVGTWGVQLNHHAQTDPCVQEAVASFGQDPIALASGRCRSRCEQTIDGCGVCGGTSYPTVELEAGPYQSYRRGQDIRLKTTVVWDNSACALSHEMVYLWSAQLDESISRTKPTLTVPSNKLPPGGSVLPVLLDIGVVPVGGSLGDAASTFATKLFANVTILRSPIVARISGGSRDVPPFVDVVLNASSSVDLDAEPGTLLFFWTCREVLSNRPCSMPGVAAPVWSIAARDLTPGMTYDFRVLVLKGDRSDSTSTRIRVAASNLPVTASLRSLTDLQYKVDPNRRLVVQGSVESLEPVQTAWSVFRKFSTGAENLEINVTDFREHRSINEVSLVVPAQSLPVTSESAEYTFRLMASGAGGMSYAEMTVYVNSAPIKGSVRVHPEQGYVFDSFRIETAESSWSDDAEDFPLACRFGYIDSRGVREDGRRYLSDTALSFVSPPVVLPVGEPPLFNYSVFVQATDVWGCSGHATTRVQVSEGNATVEDGIVSLLRTTAIGDIYTAYQIIDALSLQRPKEQSVVDQMTHALRDQVEAQAITAASTSRVVNTLGHVARNDLSDASIDNCIAVVEQVSACARRVGLGLQPCQFSTDDVDTLTETISNLFNAAQAAHATTAPGHYRRLEDSQLAAQARANVLLDMVQVLAEAVLAPLAPGESIDISAGVFAMGIHRRQELDYLHQRIPSWSRGVTLLTISNGFALPGAAFRTVGAVLTVWTGEKLPFFWDSTSTQPACLSRLLDVEVGNTTRWSRRGIFKTVCESYIIILPSDQLTIYFCDHLARSFVFLVVQCAGYPVLATSVVAVQFLTETKVTTVVTEDRNDSRPYVVRIPTDAQYGCGYTLNESGPLINCSRFDGSNWLLDGLPVERNLTHVACAFSTSAAFASIGFAAFCAPAPQYDELDLTMAMRVHTVQLAGLYVCCGILPAFIVAYVLELSRLQEKKRTAKVARKTAFREWLSKYGHRDTTFVQRIRMRSRASSHTLTALLAHLDGNPHTKAEGVILITITATISMAVCSVAFQSPVPSLLCENICTCLEDQLTGPACEYNCHVECRSFDCGSMQADHECASAASHSFCELEMGCRDFEPSSRVVRGVGAAVGVLIPIMIVARYTFVWLRAPAASYILGDKSTSVCSKCRPKPTTEPDLNAAAKYDVTDEMQQAVEEPENEIAEAIIAKLHNKFTPVHLEVTLVNESGDTPAKFKVILVSAVFKKLPADKQRRALVAATLADELGKRARIDVLESWTPAQWREIELQAEAEAKRKARQKARGQMKLTAILGRAPVEFHPRKLWPATCPYMLSFAAAVASVTVSVQYSRHFTDSTTSYWLLAAGTATLIKLTAVDLVLLLFEPNGPVYFFVAKRAWPWLRHQVQAWRGQRRVHVNRDGEFIPDLSSSEDEVDDETAVGLAWEFYHGKRHKPKPPVVETPKRPPTPEIRAWAREMHDAVEDRTAISFRKETVLKAVTLPNALDREYVPEALQKQKKWEDVMADHESKAIDAAHARRKEQMDQKAALDKAAADETQRRNALLDAARRRRERLAITAAQTEGLLAEEQVREAAVLRAAEQAQKYQQSLDEAARRRARRAELASMRNSGLVHD